MKAGNLETDNPRVHLIEPDVARDAPLSVTWLAGDQGRRTLALMGVTDKDNRPTTLAEELQRVRGFVEDPHELNWAIQLDDTVVGAIWVNLTPAYGVPEPSLHTMIGDPTARGQGVGDASTRAVIDHMRRRGDPVLYSRHLTRNTVVAGLLKKHGFVPMGEPYTDQGNLEWQNVQLDLHS